MFYNSWNKSCKNPFGSVCCEEEIEFNFYAKNTTGAVFLVFTLDDKTYKEQMHPVSHNRNDNLKVYTIKYTAPKDPCLLWYYFELHEGGNVHYYGNNEEALGGEGLVYYHAPKEYQLTVYKKNINTPSWLKNGIIYQIFVDRFFNGNENAKTVNTDSSLFFLRNWEESPQYVRDEHGNVIKYDFYGGNLKGIIKKLPYLKSLGISIIYLNPIFEAFSNHKYDTADYKKIDPMYGNEASFKILCSEAEKLGIYIILDGVFNHTGSNSVYFNKNNAYDQLGAYQSKESPFFNWYSFFTFPHYYKSWWGIETMPTINKDNENYCSFIMKGNDSVIHHWMNCGAKGWRLDVVDELPDEFVTKLKEEIKIHDPSSILIGEVWEDASNKISYGKRRKYLLGNELDSVMNYPFRKTLLSYTIGQCTASKCIRYLLNLYENYPREYFYSMMNLIGSHDVPRILSALGENSTGESKDRSIAIKRLQMITLFQMTFPGVPSIYYGDEAGLQGLGDPFNRGTYPWGKENEKILCWYKKIIFIRNSNKALRTGEWIPIYGDKYVLSYIRTIKDNRDSFNEECENGQFITLFNNDIERDHTISIPIPKEYLLSKYYVDMLTGTNVELISGKLVITVPSLQGVLLKAC